MSLLKSVGGAVAGGAIMGPVGSLIGGQAGMGGAGGMGSSGYQPEQVDPRLKEISQRQLKTAQDYRTNSENLKGQQGRQAGEGSRQNLAKSMTGINQNTNARGLLYSGVRQGAQQAAASDESARLAAQRSQINQQIEDQANQLDTSALNSAYSVQSMQQQMNDAAYKQALLNKQNEFSALGSAGKMFGSLVGSAAASKSGG